MQHPHEVEGARNRYGIPPEAGKTRHICSADTFMRMTSREMIECFLSYSLLSDKVCCHPMHPQPDNLSQQHAATQPTERSHAMCRSRLSERQTDAGAASFGCSLSMPGWLQTPVVRSEPLRNSVISTLFCGAHLRFRPRAQQELVWFSVWSGCPQESRLLLKWLLWGASNDSHNFLLTLIAHIKKARPEDICDFVEVCWL